MGRSPARAVARLLSPLVPLVAAAVVWAPLLDNYFHADDFHHLFNLRTLPLPRFLTQLWGGHLQLVRNAVFAAMYGVFGPEPRPWFWSVLLTHLLNVLLLHRVVLRLTGDLLLACLGATLWGTSPVLEGALGWYSVYGQVLLTTLVFTVLSSLAGAVAAGRPPSVRRALAWGGLLAAGAACFGTGLGIAAAFPLVVALAFPPDRRSARAAGVLVLTAAAVFTVYAVLRDRSPDLDARARELLAPGTILAAAPTVLALGASLLGYGACTLLLGPLGLDAGYPDAASLGAVAVVTALVVAGWVAADGAGRRRLLWLGTLVVAACATIAAGRATVLIAWQVAIARSAAWPRYHYLLLALLTALLCAALASLHARGRTPSAVVAGGAAVWLAARVVLLAVRPHAIDHHDAERAETAAVLRAIHEAVAAAPPGSTVTIQNRPFASAPVARPLFPGWAGVFVIEFPANVVDGRPVRFVARGDDGTLAAERGGRIAALFQRP
jgi:hypothetical protein